MLSAILAQARLNPNFNADIFLERYNAVLIQKVADGGARQPGHLPEDRLDLKDLENCGLSEAWVRKFNQVLFENQRLFSRNQATVAVLAELKARTVKYKQYLDKYVALGPRFEQLTNDNVRLKSILSETLRNVQARAEDEKLITELQAAHQENRSIIDSFARQIQAQDYERRQTLSKLEALQTLNQASKQQIDQLELALKAS